ncbi:hypothetical protein DFR68_10973 [Nocardia mexicana]|uniref:Uncharacterized protein n=1 Tax=Nocardia mexicana TaxID=279262 RepID=A0A370GV02_9NOCA|nr:hypothetical protein DFR68_10973 [Nocardia mexicana]
MTLPAVVHISRGLRNSLWHWKISNVADLGTVVEKSDSAPPRVAGVRFGEGRAYRAGRGPGRVEAAVNLVRCDVAWHCAQAVVEVRSEARR